MVPFLSSFILSLCKAPEILAIFPSNPLHAPRAKPAKTLPKINSYDISRFGWCYMRMAPFIWRLPPSTRFSAAIYRKRAYIPFGPYFVPPLASFCPPKFKSIFYPEPFWPCLRARRDSMPGSAATPRHAARESRFRRSVSNFVSAQALRAKNLAGVNCAGLGKEREDGQVLDSLCEVMLSMKAPSPPTRTA